MPTYNYLTSIYERNDCDVWILPAAKPEFSAKLKPIQRSE